MAETSPSAGPLASVKTSASSGGAYRTGIPVTLEFYLVAMADGPAPAFLVITGKIGVLQFEGLLNSPRGGIDLDQELAWINVRGGLDLGGGLVGWRSIGRQGGFALGGKRAFEFVSMGRVDRVKMVADTEISL